MPNNSTVKIINSVQYNLTILHSSNSICVTAMERDINFVILCHTHIYIKKDVRVVLNSLHNFAGNIPFLSMRGMQSFISSSTLQSLHRLCYITLIHPWGFLDALALLVASCSTLKGWALRVIEGWAHQAKLRVRWLSDVISHGNCVKS